MRNLEIYVLIGRVLSGEADAHEHYRLQQWREEAEGNQAIYEKLRQLWQETTLEEELANADRVYHRFSEKRDALTKHREKAFPKKKFTLVKKAGVAAVLMIATIAYWWLQHKRITDTSQETVAWVVKENSVGEKSKITLSDGTIVWLNAESKLRYLPNFSDTVRKITLVGEAYFQVAKELERPFVVESGGLHTTALGTAFNVRHFADDSVAVVFLKEGAVKVNRMNNSDTTVFLEPGHGVISYPDSAGLRKFADRSSYWTGWKDGVLIFKNASIREVVKTCERWYSAEFSIRGVPPSNWKFTGKFNNESLENVLESMKYGKDVDYKIQDKQVIVYFKN